MIPARKIAEDMEDIRAALAGRQAPFFSSLLARARVIATTGVERAAVDDRTWMYINPTYWAERSFIEKAYIVSHEIGHWHLHRFYYLASEGQASLFGDAGMPSVICRASSAKEPREWQADKFAGCLLMPRRMVRAAWEAEHGALTPYSAKQEMDSLAAKYRLSAGERPVVDVAKRMANLFRVSGQAMQIRLMDMGLVRLDQQHTLTL